MPRLSSPFPSLRFGVAVAWWVLLALSGLAFTGGFGSVSEKEAFRRVMEVPEAGMRAVQLLTFLERYPDSPHRQTAWRRLSKDALEVGDGETAVPAFEAYAAGIPEENRWHVAAVAAHLLSKKRLQLDEAEAFVREAVTGARENHGSGLSSLLDTQGRILCLPGCPEDAERVLEEAREDASRIPGFWGGLAFYQHAGGKYSLAWQNLARAQRRQRAAADDGKVEGESFGRGFGRTPRRPAPQQTRPPGSTSIGSGGPNGPAR